MNHALQAEMERRRVMWASLLDEGGPLAVAPNVLRRLRIYGGAQGIWVDKERTAHLTEHADGVTVGLLHTGRLYADDLSEDGIIYHYPSTNRPPARDLAEINATKSARNLRLPLFLITYPSPGSSKRNVHLGWVEDWDDAWEAFLVTFGEQAPPAPEPVDEEPFRLDRETTPPRREVATPMGQQRFKFLVFQRYGPSCAVCGIRVAAVLDAAHLKPRRQRGTDDPRNGLVLCALHHRALDAGLFAVHPDTLEIRTGASGPDSASLRIVHPTLQHLHKTPHRDALQWLWQHWSAKHGNT